MKTTFQVAHAMPIACSLPSKQFHHSHEVISALSVVFTYSIGYKYSQISSLIHY